MNLVFVFVDFSVKSHILLFPVVYLFLQISNLMFEAVNVMTGTTCRFMEVVELVFPVMHFLLKVIRHSKLDLKFLINLLVPMLEIMNLVLLAFIEGLKFFVIFLDFQVFGFPVIGFLFVVM